MASEEVSSDDRSNEGASGMRLSVKIGCELVFVTATGIAARFVAERTGQLAGAVTLLDGRRNDIYPALVGLAGSLLGFTVASLTILIGYAESPRLDIIRRSEQWDNLFTAFTASIRWSGYVTILSILATLFDQEGAANFGLQSALVVGLGVMACLIARMIWVLHAVLDVVSRPGNRAPGT